MKLLFQSSNGSERVIAEVNSFAEASEEMDKFLDEHSFKSYYKRLWEEDGRLKIDVGSWSEFFFISGCCLDDVHREQETCDKED